MVQLEDVDIRLVRRAIEDLSRGAGSGLCGSVLAGDVRWYEPGRNLVAGEYVGCDEVGLLFGLLRDLSERTFAVVEWEAVASAEDRTVSVYAVRARRGGRDLLSRDVCVVEVSGERILSAQVFHADQHAWDRFWS